MANGTILVVDDSPTQQKLICAPFEAQGYEVHAVGDGSESLAAIQVDNHFDLVIMDVVMPKMNGFQACKKIRKLRQDLPIILLSTKDQTSDAYWAIHQGANLYMTKPFDSQELFDNAVKLMAGGQP